MSESGDSVIPSIGILFGFLTSVIILFAVSIGDRYPFIMAGGGIIFLCAGIAGFVLAAIESPHYKHVFDYESARFWGKERNGKAIRNIIVTILMISIWGFASAIVMLVVSLPIIF